MDNTSGESQPFTDRIHSGSLSIQLLEIVRILFLLTETSYLSANEVGRAIAAWRYRLSHEDVELLKFLAEGLTNCELADRLGVADEYAVKNRLKIVFKKLRVSNRVQAA